MNTAGLEKALADAMPHLPAPSEPTYALPLLLHNAQDGKLGNNHPLERLLDEIRQEKEFEAFNGLMQVMPGYARRVEHTDLASWLMRRAQDVGVRQAIDDLATYLGTERLLCRHIVAVAGIRPTASYSMGSGITLLSWDQLEKSRTKAVIDERFFLGGSDHPEAALVRELGLPRLHVAHDELSKHMATPRSYWEELSDLLLCLGLVGPTAPISLASWLEPPEWAPIMSGGYSFSLTDGFAFPRTLPSNAPAEGARIHALWNALTVGRRAELHVPMVRLNSAMRRRSPVDAAIDLGIALESIFLRDLSDDRGELTLRLRVRAGRWLGSSPTERKEIALLVGDLYGIRSKAVHRGHVPDKTRGRPTTELLEEGFKLTARSLIALIESSDPDWEDVTFG